VGKALQCRRTAFAEYMVVRFGSVCDLGFGNVLFSIFYSESEHELEMLFTGLVLRQSHFH
jgi:hypothetical protein